MVAGLLGAGVVVMPAIAGSETAPSITAVNGPGIYSHHWSPEQATIAPGASVTLSNATTVKHGVRWASGPTTPQCSGVPVGSTEADSGIEWSGTCTFPTAGVYGFYCTVHGPAMSGSVTVASAGTTPTPSTTPPPTPEAPGYAPPGGPAGSPAPGPGSGAASPLLGTASRAVRLSAGPHGRSVRGSVAVSPTGAGGRLEVDLLLRRAELAGASARLVRVGRTVRTSLAGGRVPFSVALDARARRALRARHRLALSVRVLLTPPHGAAVSVVRPLVLR